MIVMNKITPEELRINQYLGAVKEHLGALSTEEVDEILDSIRAHIDSELRTRGKEGPGLALVEAVLAEMDPPESYAETTSALEDVDLTGQRFSRYPIIGTILLPFGILMALLMLVAIPGGGVGGAMTGWQWLARYIILPLGIVAPFACTALGIMGISEINKSGGRIIGLPLALFVGIFYPILLIDGILFVLALRLFDGASYWNIAILVSVLFILVVDFFIIRTAWRWANSGDVSG